MGKHKGSRLLLTREPNTPTRRNKRPPQVLGQDIPGGFWVEGLRFRILRLERARIQSLKRFQVEWFLNSLTLEPLNPKPLNP